MGGGAQGGGELSHREPGGSRNEVEFGYISKNICMHDHHHEIDVIAIRN
jgi:hypothetical protein|tara:strand:- start:398 stop:544 length:147 start_codon:yes stop_codon:yes gene_type:complete